MRSSNILLNIQVDYLINNAGFGGHGIFHERSLEKHLEMIQVNITALTALIYYFIPHMIANRRGRIMNVSSTAAFLPGPLQAVYYASKSYVKLFGEALHNELRDTNISVTTLCPGATSTEFASTGDLENTAIFQRKTRLASSVPKYDYRAMKKGKRVAINEPLLRFFLNYLLPLFPRRCVIQASRMAMEPTGKEIKVVAGLLSGSVRTGAWVQEYNIYCRTDSFSKIISHLIIILGLL